MAVGQLRTVVVDCLDPAPLAQFWSVLLGLAVRFADEEWGALEPLGPGLPRLVFHRVPETKQTKNRRATSSVSSTRPARKDHDMQQHNFSVDLNAPVDEVWDLFWYRAPDRPQGKLGQIHILHPGDEIGEGLVRHCTFPVPKLLGSGGVGRSWEWLTQVKLHESWRYDAVGKPLWSRAEGFTRLEDLGDGRTRVHFREQYECFNPWMRRVGMERWVHSRISRDNDTILAALDGGLKWHRKRRARESAAEA